MTPPPLPTAAVLRALVVACAVLALPATEAIAQSIELSASDTMIVAHEAEQPLWSRTHAGLEGAAITSPVVVGDAVVYAAGTWLYRVDARTGVVQRTIPLPTVPDAISADGDVALIEASGEVPAAWSRTWRVGPESDDVPLVLPTDSHGRQLARDAEAVIRGVGAGHGAPAELTLDELVELLIRGRHTDEVVQALRDAASSDPTSPWLPAYAAMVLSRAYRVDEARAELTRIPQMAPDLGPQLLTLHAEVRDAWSTELRAELDDVRDAAIRGMLAEGYVPALARSSAVVPLFAGEMPDTDNLDLSAVQARAAMLWDVAPRAEGASFHFRALADALRRDDQSAMASQWEQRALATAPYARLDRMSPAAAEAGEWLMASSMFALALIVAWLVRYIRYAQATWSTDVPAWRRWTVASFTKLELIGLLVLAGMAWASADRADHDAAVVDALNTAPDPVVMGNPGHPEAAAWWALGGDDDAARYMRALSLAHGNELEEAAALFEALGDPASVNNLGVLAARGGDEIGARVLYRRALEADPELTEAAWNLDQPAESATIEPYALWNADVAVLAVPDDERLAAAWEAVAINTAASDLQAPGLVGAVAPWRRVIILVISGLCLLGLVLPRPPVDQVPTTHSGMLGWTLAWLLPGSARGFGPLGPPLWGVFVVSLAVFWFVQSTQGAFTNPIDAVGLADASSKYGLYAPVAMSDDIEVARFGYAWIGLLLLHLVVVFVAERFVPDPLGPNLSLVGAGEQP